MSLKQNIFASYVSQIYVAIIGIVVVPLYVRHMGAEAYGVVGFFVMLQAWFQLLDMGLTPTMARETARFNGGASDALSLRRLLRALEGIFIGIAAHGCIAMMAGAGAIASSWLKVQQLPLVEVEHSIMLIAVIVALRWVCGLYRGAINGFERLVWLSGFNILVATARFVLVIPLFIYVGTSLMAFFAYQLAIAVVELIVLVSKTYSLLPKVNGGQQTTWQWEPLRGVLKFSLTIAFTGSVWVLVTQTDKLVLSKLLPLTDYAYFTMAVLVASGIMIISGPISGALLPRMTRLDAAGDEAGLIRLYRSATQFVGVIAIPAALVLAFFAEQVLWAWTGDEEFAKKFSLVLTLYAVGNGILALSAFPYYLQFAKGDLKLHLIGNVLFVVMLIPALIWATLQYGVIGAGKAWLGTNLLSFLFWVPLVHHRFVKGLHTQWLLRDVMPIMVVSIIVAFVLRQMIVWPVSQLAVAMVIVSISIGLCMVAAISSSCARALILGRSVRVSKRKIYAKKD